VAATDTGLQRLVNSLRANPDGTALRRHGEDARLGGSHRVSRAGLRDTGFRGPGCVTGVEEEIGRGAHEGAAADSYD
jgi:hypothetical protein